MEVVANVPNIICIAQITCDFTYYTLLVYQGRLFFVTLRWSVFFLLVNTGSSCWLIFILRLPSCPQITLQRILSNFRNIHLIPWFLRYLLTCDFDFMVVPYYGVIWICSVLIFFRYSLNPQNNPRGDQGSYRPESFLFKYFSRTFQGLFKDKSHFFKDFFPTQFDIHVINPQFKWLFVCDVLQKTCNTNRNLPLMWYRKSNHKPQKMFWFCLFL